MDIVPHSILVLFTRKERTQFSTLINMGLIDTQVESTSERRVEFSFKTKLFDFGHPELTKNINTVNFTVSAVPLDFQVKYPLITVEIISPLFVASIITIAIKSLSISSITTIFACVLIASVMSNSS